MLVKDMMTRSFETLRPDDDLKRVAGLFRSTRLEILPVIEEDGRLIGIMTKANLYDAVAQGRQPETAIRDLITTDIMTLNEDIPYEEVKEVVRTSHAGNAIVLNDQGNVSGIFHKAAWIRAMLGEETRLNAQLNAILQTMHNGLIAVDKACVITRINKAAETILGAEAADAVGRRFGELMPGLKLDDVITSGKPSIGARHTVKDLSLLCNITPITREEMINGAIIVFQDLTDLIRIIEELESITKLYRTLQSVMDFAYDGIVVVDENGCITMINKAAQRFLCNREELIIGRPVEEVIENTRLHKVVKTGVPEINHLQFIKGIPYVVSSQPIIRRGQVVGAVGKILFRNLEELKVLAKRLASLDRELSELNTVHLPREPKDSGFDQIVTADPAFRQVIEEAEIVARGTSNILITGESGTGKELIAQAIHKTSSNPNGPLIKVNCAAIPASLMESEFFGYVPGAFTGAQRSGKKGKLAMADGGTLFLDEIGDLPLALQSKLLRVIQDKSFEPVGSNKPCKVNVRFIAATNQSLEDMVTDGRFRSDLYYRLNVIHLHIPPLKERRQDIDLLVQFFLEKYNRIFATHIKDISRETRGIFFDHGWPGNVRELENVIERAVNFARGKFIEKQDLPHYLRDTSQPFVQKKPSSTKNTLLKPSRADHERDVIIEALKLSGGNKAQAARILGISRSWLYEKMITMGLSGKIS
ncbi:MAG: sigma 54-interacting transcriptional regulator [Deltaproteobacteria bacterium]|nr:sigma 54-interacting transcriptional regulator [Deltaproteobacteria bacterium]